MIDDDITMRMAPAIRRAERSVCASLARKMAVYYREAAEAYQGASRAAAITAAETAEVIAKEIEGLP
jgi:hypothetical protein